jgi:hypothetical protein
MYGPQTSDLANALMADRHRQAAGVARERSARPSRLPQPDTTSRGRSIAALLGGAVASARLALARPRPSTSAY